MTPAHFSITQADRHTSVWRALAEHYETRLDDLRKQNDNAGKDLTETAYLRGRIAEIKMLLNLGTDGLQA